MKEDIKQLKEKAKRELVALGSEERIGAWNSTATIVLLEDVEFWFQNWFSQLEQAVREEMMREIIAIVEKWMETSNPAHAEDLFDKLQSQLEEIKLKP
jgi:hypothetical protein